MFLSLLKIEIYFLINSNAVLFGSMITPKYFIIGAHIFFLYWWRSSNLSNSSYSNWIL